MSSERQPSLALMNIDYDQDIDVDALIKIFCSKLSATLVAR